MSGQARLGLSGKSSPRGRELYDKVEVVTSATDGRDIVPAGSRRHGGDLPEHPQLDGARTMRRRRSPRMYKALKPGGILGVVEHRGNPRGRRIRRPRAGYVNEEFAIELIEARASGWWRSPDQREPEGHKDYEQGVWTLPPSYRLGDKDREKYAAIGESDRFTLKFVKPGK